MLFQCDDLKVNILSVCRLSWNAGTFDVAPRPFCALAYRVRGTGSFSSGNVFVHASPGDVIYMPGGYPYRAEYTSGEILAVHFSAEEYGGGMENFTPENGRMLYELFLNLYRVWESRGIGYRFAAAACFYEILAEMQRQNFARSKQSGNKRFFDAVRFLENNFKNPELNIASVCAAAGISDTCFRRRFKQVYNRCPLDYLTELRINYAEKLLADRCFTIEETALMCGFSDTKYFSRVIKKRYGCPPSRLFQL